MLKLLFAILGSVVCLALALVPEGVMVLAWHLVGPTNEYSRLLCAFALAIVGIGPCILFAVLTFALWCSFITAVLDA